MSGKKLLLIAVAVALAAAPVMFGAGVPSAQAQDDSGQRTITVTGYGTSYGAPDIVRIGLGVESINQDIMAAMDDATTRMNAVIQALQDAGVAPEDLRTEYYSIYQDYGYAGPVADESGQPRPNYRVSTTVTATVRDTQNVAELISQAVAAGANIVNYIQFDLADRSALEAEARDSAVADARARADQLAATLGLTVGEPIRVVEGSDQYAQPMYSGGAGGGMVAASAPPVSGGSLSVSMAVTITYAVQ